MSTSIDLLLRVIDDHELLVGVVPFVHCDLPNAYAALKLQFSATTVFISVNEDHDVIEVSRDPPADTEAVHAIEGSYPWNEAIHRPMLWVWQLTNHQGYPDGIQFAFLDEESGIEAIIIQAMGKASTLEIGVVRWVSRSDPGDASNNPDRGP